MTVISRRRLLVGVADGGSLAEKMQAAIKDGDLAIIHSPIDVLGVQYYTPTYVSASGDWVTVKPTSDASWEQIYPAGLYDLLTRIKRDYGDIPQVITENGMAVADSLAANGTGSGGASWTATTRPRGGSPRPAAAGTATA